MRKTAVWNIRTWPGRSRRCLFVGNRAGRRFRPVSRHEPTMNNIESKPARMQSDDCIAGMSGCLSST